MSDIDFSRLQPLRLAVGSHSEGSGFGCAMNVVSYITGDVEITDFPKCAHRDLARMVQRINDFVGVTRGSVQYIVHDHIAKRMHTTLNPEDAVCVVNLGCMTIGTAGIEARLIVTAVAEVMVEAGVTRRIYIGTPAQAIDHLNAAGYNADFMMDFGEKVLTKVRELAGLDAAEAVTLPEGVLL